MNKKGFTLVELLAVIVIMAIVVLIAIPNVMNSLNQAKKDNFGNEVNSLYSTAKTQFNLDKGRGKIKYKTVDGRRYVKYKIMLDVDGRVAYMYITDGRFLYVCSDSDECSEFSELYIMDKADSGSNIDDVEIQYGPMLQPE